MKFKSDIEVQAGIRDSSGAIGTSGQVLSSTGSNVSWINQTTVASDVQNLVKAGVAINKGQAVYVTGADGTNIIVGLASNTSEATSSKTLGLLNATVAVNGFADVVQIGRLSGLNTIGATAGDPVWLGTNGNLIYGLLNKPYAPKHLVFIGIVTRVNANNGEIFINVQNGFELNEIHDVDLKTNVPINGDVLGYDGTLWVNKTIAEWLGYTPANANGTTNYVSKFTGATTLGDSQIFDNGTFVGIGTNAPNATLQVGNGTGVKAIYVTGSGTNLGLGGLSVSFLGFATGTISTVNTSGAVPLGVGTRSTQPLILGTNNAERMRIDSSGNVGIGTTSPGQKLEVNGNIKLSSMAGSTATPSYINLGLDYSNGTTKDKLKVYLYNSGGEQYGFTVGSVSDVQYHSNAIHDFYLNNSAAVRINSTGLGIGTTTPSAKLDVNGRALVNEFQYTKAINISGANLNDYTFAGFYNGEGMANAPNSGWFWVTVERYSGDDNWAHQTATTFGSGNTANEVYTRTKSGGTWTNWKRLIDWGDVNGTTNYVSKFTGNNSLGNSSIFDNGSAVGIFTSAPGFVTPGRGVLSLNGSSNSLMEFQAGGAFKSYLYQSGTNFEIYDTNAILFAVSGSERMRITSSGNVGIGTSSPGYKLDVEGIINVNATPGSYGTLIRLRDTVISGTESFGGVHFTSGPGTDYTIGKWSTAAGAGLLQIRDQSGNAFMTINGGGNVGIGTTSPSSKLHVYSSGEISRLESSTTTMYQTFRANGTNVGYIGNGTGVISGGSATDFGIQIANNFVISTGGSSERMRITSSGNVGIGTASPNKSAILHLRSTTRGFLPPVMITGERNGISSPAIGLMIFNEEEDAVQVYTGEGWRTLAFL